MNGSALLDTNIVIALIADDDSVKRGLKQARRVFIPSIALGELNYGARTSAQKKRNLARIAEIAATTSLQVVDAATAEEYGTIKAALRAKGRLIPDNDVRIAAIARQHGLTLVTRDAHFQEVEDLAIEAW
jgi:tRNA(fMet)-specific endonuclease VapC